MDGQNAQKMHLETHAWPNSLTLDSSSKMIYFVDARLDQLRAVNYEGQGLKPIPFSHRGSPHMKHPFVVDLIPSINAVLWNDWRADGLITAKLNQQKDQIANSSLVYAPTKFSTLYALIAISQEKQPKVENVLRENDTCSENQFCVTVPNRSEQSGSDFILQKCLDSQ